MILYQKYVHIWFFLPDGSRQWWQGEVCDMEREAMPLTMGGVSISPVTLWADTWTGSLLTTIPEYAQMLTEFQPGTNIHLLYKNKGRRDTYEGGKLLGKLLNCQPIQLSVPRVNEYEPDMKGNSSGRVFVQLVLSFRLDLYFLDFVQEG